MILTIFTTSTKIPLFISQVPRIREQLEMSSFKPVAPDSDRHFIKLEHQSGIYKLSYEDKPKKKRKDLTD